MDVPDIGRNSYLNKTSKKVDKVRLEKLHKDKNNQHNERKEPKVNKSRRLDNIEGESGGELDIKL